MATSEIKPDLVISVYDPTQTKRKRQLQRSAALSHAAKTSYIRRIHARYPPHRSVKQPWDHTKLPNTSWKDLQIRQYVYQKPAHGNSDPFDAMVVKITPEVTMLLALWREHAESNAVAATRWISDTALKQDLSFDNKLHAEALLLMCTALLSSQRPDRQDLYIRRLERKHACIQQLKSLLRSRPANEDVFVRGLSLIFMATIYANEADEATIHATRMYQALARIKGPRIWDDPEHVIILSRMYYHDQQCALTYMRSPILDPDVPVKHWHATLEPLHAYIRHHGLVPVPASVSHPAFSTELARLFGRLQEYITIQSMQVPEQLGFLEGHAHSSFIIYSIELTTRFFQHLQYAERRHLDATDLDAHAQWQHEIILTLGALAFLVYVKGGPELFSLRTQGRAIIAALRGNLERTKQSPTAEGKAYQQAQLWALFIGAIWEWDSGVYETGERWHSRELQSKLEEQGIASWNDLRAVIYEFLYIPPAKRGRAEIFLDMSDEALGQKPLLQTGTQFVKVLLFPGAGCGI